MHKTAFLLFTSILPFLLTGATVPSYWRRSNKQWAPARKHNGTFLWGRPSCQVAFLLLDKFIGTLLEKRRRQSLLIKQAITFATPNTAKIYLPWQTHLLSRSPSCCLGHNKRISRDFKLLIITNLTHRTDKGRLWSSIVIQLCEDTSCVNKRGEFM